MLYHGHIITDTITNGIIATFLLSVWFNPRCAYAIAISLITAKLTYYYGVAPLHLIALVVCAFISIGKLDGIKLTLIEVESNEVNYLISATFIVRVAVWTLYLLGLFGDEALYVSSMLLILFELIVVLGSLHNGTNLHRLTDTDRAIHNNGLHNERLAKQTSGQKINRVG